MLCLASCEIFGDGVELEVLVSTDLTTSWNGMRKRSISRFANHMQALHEGGVMFSRRIDDVRI